MRTRPLTALLMATSVGCQPESAHADYPSAAELIWEQPSESHSAQLDLRDGSRIELFGRNGLRCRERTGDLRWVKIETEAEVEPEPADTPVCLASGDKVLLADETLVYVVQYSPYRTGASVVAFNLGTGRQAWGQRVHGLGTVRHSRYSNLVGARLIQSAIVVFGNESGGDYIEVMSPAGKILSTSVVRKR